MTGGVVVPPKEERISTHTLRKEGDDKYGIYQGEKQLFQPTPSARRVTISIPAIPGLFDISTHTLRKEGDNPCVCLQVDI